MTVKKWQSAVGKILPILIKFSDRQKQCHINNAAKKERKKERKKKKYLSMINAKFRTAMACWCGGEV